jgi:hypothetical protein
MVGLTIDGFGPVVKELAIEPKWEVERTGYPSRPA